MSYLRPPLPECNECGICCTTDLEYGRGGFVRLQKEDYDRLPGKYQLKVVLESELNLDRLGTKGSPATGYRCVALKGTPGVRTSCDIYDQRPNLCRTFERGSPDCHKERANWFYAKDTRP